MKFAIRNGAACLLAMAFVAGCAQTPRDEADDMTVAHGREIAQKNCSTCHAIDNEMASPNSNAPPLLSILMRYDSERLAEDFVEGTRVGHDEMPHFTFTVREADALVAYLKDIERTPRAAEK